MMDSQNQQEPPAAQLRSTYPSAPMEYVNMYTNENVKSGKAPAPPKIIKDNYTSFGRLLDPNEVLIRSLESQGIQQLYSLNTPTASTSSDPTTTQNRPPINTNSYKRELKKLNHSILIAYLDLLEVLVKAPNTQIQIEQPAPVQINELGEQVQNTEPIVIIKTLREQKLEDLEVLFINMHHLINELRPHQARDNIRCILEMQKQQRADIADKFRDHLHKIVDLLRKCVESIQPASRPNTTFMDELNVLMKSADQLSKSLDKFRHHTQTNGYHDNDVDMLNEEAQSNLISLVTSGSRRGHSAVGKRLVNGHANDTDAVNKNCDIKDLILCDLIDEFLIKENEF